MNIKWATIYSCLASMLALNAPLSFAAENMEEYFAMSPAELAAMPVTIATGTPKPNFRSAGSTSVITAEQIKTMGATELHEILETVPGVHASLQPITNDYQYSVRGIANKTNSEMLFLLNGTRITTPFQGTTLSGSELPVAAIERVEVVRGPGSAVYGADAFAGVINIITKKAKDINGTQLGVRAGNWDTQSGWGQHGGHYAGWDIATSIQYQHTQGDSGRILKEDSQTIFDQNMRTNASLAPSAMNTRLKSLNTHLNLQRKHWDIGFWATNVLDVGTRAGGAGALDPKGGGDSAQYLGDVRFSTEDWFTDWEFMAHFSYLHSDVHANAHIYPDNAVFPIGSDGKIVFDLTKKQGVASFPDGVIEDIRHVQQIPSFELSSIYKGLDKHQFRFNAGLRHEDIAITELTNNANIAPGPSIVNGKLTNVTGTKNAFLKDSRRTVWSLMLQDEWHIADDWHLTAGVRYDHYSDFGSTVNPRFALVWDINEKLTSKLLYGKAFRAPTFTELYTQNNPILLGNPNLKPETINTVEWAFDYRPFSSFRTALNLYYYDLESQITTNSTLQKGSNPNPNPFKYNNSGNQTAYGTELEWNWKVSEQWNLLGNYAWRNARDEKNHKQVMGVEHQIYFATTWQFMPKWQLQSQLNWVGGRIRAPLDKRPLKDYETIDFTLRGSKLWGHLNLAASLRNAFDSNNFEPARLDMPKNLPLPGRSFYFEASVDF